MLLVLLASAGCHWLFPYGPGDLDSARSIDGVHSPEQAARDKQRLPDLSLPSCPTQGVCAAGTTCLDGKCVPAASSCAEQAERYPASTDGVYWILLPGKTPYRAYCDMRLKAELCNETPASHQGKTRESSELAYVMTSVLSYDLGYCELWALRGIDDYPIDRLDAQYATTKTCVALGFLDDHTLGKCAFGRDTVGQGCGFPIGTDYYRYGNKCTSCEKNDGAYPQYKLQGYMYDSWVLTTMDNTTTTRCKVR